MYGRELGEDFPSWQEEFEYIAQLAPDEKELAKQGNIDAINALIAQCLQNTDVVAKAKLKNNCLQIILEADEFVDQPALELLGNKPENP